LEESNNINWNDTNALKEDLLENELIKDNINEHPLDLNILFCGLLS